MTSQAGPGGPETPISSLSGELLRARVARAQMYLIELEPVAGAATDAALERDHLAYLVALEQAGTLYAAGPLDPAGDGAGREIAVIAAPSREAAEEIAAADPTVTGGAFNARVRSYTINEGVACYVARAMSKRSRPAEAATDAGLTLDDLRKHAAGVDLYLVHLNPTAKPRPAEDTATMDAHFVWLRENEMAARLVCCGPLQGDQPPAPGIWGGGLGVLATSRAEAEAIAAAEPSGVVGYRSLTVTPWRVDFGVAAPIAGSLRKLNALPV